MGSSTFFAFPFASGEKSQIPRLQKVPSLRVGISVNHLSQYAKSTLNVGYEANFLDCVGPPRCEPRGFCARALSCAQKNVTFVARQQKPDCPK